jgi:hypothetical protein
VIGELLHADLLFLSGDRRNVMAAYEIRARHDRRWVTVIEEGWRVIHAARSYDPRVAPPEGSVG